MSTTTSSFTCLFACVSVFVKRCSEVKASPPERIHGFLGEVVLMDKVESFPHPRHFSLPKIHGFLGSESNRLKSILSLCFPYTYAYPELERQSRKILFLEFSILQKICGKFCIWVVDLLPG